MFIRMLVKERFNMKNDLHSLVWEAKHHDAISLRGETGIFVT